MMAEGEAYSDGFLSELVAAYSLGSAWARDSLQGLATLAVLSSPSVIYVIFFNSSAFLTAAVSWNSSSTV